MLTKVIINEISVLFDFCTIWCYYDLMYFKYWPGYHKRLSKLHLFCFIIKYHNLLNSCSGPLVTIWIRYLFIALFAHFFIKPLSFHVWLGFINVRMPVKLVNQGWFNHKVASVLTAASPLLCSCGLSRQDTMSNFDWVSMWVFTVVEFIFYKYEHIITELRELSLIKFSNMITFFRMAVMNAAKFTSAGHALLDKLKR